MQVGMGCQGCHSGFDLKANFKLVLVEREFSSMHVKDTKPLIVWVSACVGPLTLRRHGNTWTYDMWSLPLTPCDKHRALQIARKGESNLFVSGLCFLLPHKHIWFLRLALNINIWTQEPLSPLREDQQEPAVMAETAKVIFRWYQGWHRDTATHYTQ